MNTTDYKGIDYSGNQPVNIDTEADIRYGVIPYNRDPDLTQFWVDESQQININSCPHCGEQWVDSDDEQQQLVMLFNYNAQRYEVENTDDEWILCPVCQKAFNPDEMVLPDKWFIDNDTYKAIHTGGSDTDVFIIKSLYYTYAQFCSPCAPGACYLLNPLSGSEQNANNKAYCFGHECFDGGIAPYPVYDVETGKRVMLNVDNQREQIALGDIRRVTNIYKDTLPIRISLAFLSTEYLQWLISVREGNAEIADEYHVSTYIQKEQFGEDEKREYALVFYPDENAIPEGE